MGDLEEEIFGADSDDDIFENKATDASKPSLETAIFGGEEDDLFQDSDDDRPTAGGGGKLKKLGSKKGISESRLVDSDDESAPRKKDLKKAKKRRREEKGSKKERKLQKTEGKSEKDNYASSGDEYDSGEDVRETQDDRDFIDEDDDLADVRNEYDEDQQNFDDDRPIKPSKGKSSSASKAASSSSYVPKTKDLDPLSITLNEIRKPKLKAFSDAEKDIMAEKLLKKMAQAVELDDECFRKKEPAVHKLKLLPAVERAVAMKDLHNTLLEKDFLCYLRDWIEPKNASTLPALSLRTSVYDMLRKLPCLTEHLKRGNDKMPIGYVIVALRKHKMETPENKRLLKEIMDKWSRPIFSKTEGTGEGVSFAHTENEEVKAALVRKYSDSTNSRSAGNTTGDYGSLQSILGGGAGGSVKKEPQLHNRARAPTSHGYLFTVQPELKNIDKRNVMEKALGEERMKLFKKMTEGGKSSSTGKKSNPRYVTRLSFLLSNVNLINAPPQLLER
eukprot:gene4169-4462_t